MGLLRFLRGKAPVPPGQEQRFAEGAADLHRGLLPRWVSARLDDERANVPFGGPLSTGDSVALREIGYEAVGQVFGTATYQVSRMQTQLGMVLHGGYLGAPGGFNPGYWASGARPGYGSRAINISWWQGESGCRTAALRRLSQEAEALDADGVIGVQTVAETYHAPHVYECSFIGLAVRSRQRHGKPADRPFTAHFSPVEFRSLLQAGWLPKTVMLRWQRRAAHAQLANYWTTFGELSSASDLIRSSVDLVRHQMEMAIRAEHGSGMVLQELTPQSHGERCEWGGIDFYCDVRAAGTSIVRSRPGPISRQQLGVLPMIRLDTRGGGR
ncbi:MAG: hypothetical protein ACR2KJ_16100 [Jatrophihabitans sp.]